MKAKFDADGNVFLLRKRTWKQAECPLTPGGFCSDKCSLLHETGKYTHPHVGPGCGTRRGWLYDLVEDERPSKVETLQGGTASTAVEAVRSTTSESTDAAPLISEDPSQIVEPVTLPTVAASWEGLADSVAAAIQKAYSAGVLAGIRAGKLQAQK